MKLWEVSAEFDIGNKTAKLTFEVEANDIESALVVADEELTAEDISGFVIYAISELLINE